MTERVPLTADEAARLIEVAMQRPLDRPGMRMFQITDDELLAFVDATRDDPTLRLIVDAIVRRECAEP